MKRVMLIFGTRPEAIKMAPVVKMFKNNHLFETLVCVTGQHREMLDQVLNIFDITPDFDLNIMQAGQDLYDVTSRVLLGLRSVFAQSRPDIVLVHGDTTTSTIAALAAFYSQIPVAHVEAGLRTDDIYNPFPEEMNRQLTGRIAKIHFAPTQGARHNLLHENISDTNIFVTGNTVIDALFLALEKIETNPELEKNIISSLKKANFNTDVLTKKNKVVLITGHRRENFGDGFISICEAIKTLTERFPEVAFVYPMHLNPNVRKPIAEILGENKSNLFLIEPLEYLEFVYLMKKSYLILTDSGGIQEEAPSLGKPVLVMRTMTERPEAVDAGTVRLVGTDYQTIVDEVSSLLVNTTEYAKMSNANNPYGDGSASERILNQIISFLNLD